MAIKFSQLGDVILKAIESKTVLEEAGKVAVESIQKRTRVGKGVIEPEGNATPLPKLAKSTVEKRKREVTSSKEKVKKSFSERLNEVRKGKFKKALKDTKSKTTKTKSANVDPQYFSPAKSNLTFTGDLLRSVDSKAKRGEIEVFLNDNESKRKAKEVLKINSGYEFMNLSKAEINRITEAITVELVKILEKIKFTGF